MAFPSDSARTKNWGNEVLTDSDLEAQFDLLHNYFIAALNASTGHNHDGTSNQGPKLSPANMVITSQAQGDILYASSSTAWARLAAGTSGRFLKTQGAGANPTWSDVNFQTAATQAEMEAASSLTVPVTPGRTQYHPGVAKAWCVLNGTGTPAMKTSHNMDSSITDNGVGDYTVSFTTDFSGTNYALAGMANNSAGAAACYLHISGNTAAGSVRIVVVRGSTEGTVDEDTVTLIAFGDQA